MIDENKKKLLKEGGREMAAEMLHGAVTTAENPEQKNNQLRVLHSMSVHILATQIYNVVKDEKATFDEALEMVSKSILKEYVFMRQCEADGELVLSKCKDAKEKQ